MPLLKSVFNFPHIFPIYSALQPLHASQSIKLFVHKFATNALVDMAIVEFNNSQPSVICQISIIYCVRVGLQQFLVSAEYNVIYCVYVPRSAPRAFTEIALPHTQTVPAFCACIAVWHIHTGSHTHTHTSPSADKRLWITATRRGNTTTHSGGRTGKYLSECLWARVCEYLCRSLCNKHHFITLEHLHWAAKLSCGCSKWSGCLKLRNVNKICKYDVKPLMAILW